MATIKNPHSHICLEMIKIKTPTTWQRPQLLLHQSQAQFQPNYSRLPEPEQPTIWKDAGSVSGGPTGPSSRLVYDCPAGGEANR